MAMIMVRIRQNSSNPDNPSPPNNVRGGSRFRAEMETSVRCVAFANAHLPVGLRPCRGRCMRLDAMLDEVAQLGDAALILQHLPVEAVRPGEVVPGRGRRRAWRRSSSQAWAACSSLRKPARRSRWEPCGPGSRRPAAAGIPGGTAAPQKVPPLCRISAACTGCRSLEARMVVPCAAAPPCRDGSPRHRSRPGAPRARRGCGRPRCGRCGGRRPTSRPLGLR